MEKLYVVTALFNPFGFQALYRNYERFAAAMRANADVVLITVECAFAERPFVVTEAGNKDHLQVRTKSVLWLKENLLNLGFAQVGRAYPEARKIAWTDADVDFLDPLWAEKTLLALDHYEVIQNWSECIYDGPNEEYKGHVESFMSHYARGEKWAGHPPKYGSLWHPGFSWAGRRESIEKVGGLLDISVVGEGDLQMALALVGLADEALRHEKLEDDELPKYAAAIRAWQERADYVIRGNVGVVQGMIRHHWHGRHVDRQYDARKQIPRDHGYDPGQHIVRNIHGVYELSHHSTKLRDDLRRHLGGRNDDANVA